MTTIGDAPETPEKSEPASATSARMASWRAHSFGPASEQPYRRRTSDWVRLVIGVGILVFTIWHQDDPGAFERNLFTTLNRLPSELDSVFRLLYAVGALWALGVVVIAAIVARRWRLARDMAIGGVLTWVLARIIGALVVDNEGLVDALHVATRFGKDSPGFPAVRLGIIVAVISVASPYLTRPTRRLGGLLVLPSRSRRSTSGPRCPTARSPQSRSGGRSQRWCTSCSDRRADAPPPPRCRPRSWSSASTCTTCTCCRCSRARVRR